MSNSVQSLSSDSDVSIIESSICERKNNSGESFVGYSTLVGGASDDSLDVHSDPRSMNSDIDSPPMKVSSSKRKHRKFVLESDSETDRDLSLETPRASSTSIHSAVLGEDGMVKQQKSWREENIEQRVSRKSSSSSHESSSAESQVQDNVYESNDEGKSSRICHDEDERKSDGEAGETVDSNLRKSSISASSMEQPESECVENQPSRPSSSTGNENNDSVVCLGDYQEENENPASRQIELRMERRKLELELEKVNSEIKKLKASVDNVDPNSLPDGGEKIKITLMKRVKIRNILAGRIKEFDSQLAKMPKEIKPKPVPLSETNSNRNYAVPPSHLNVDIESMGKQALATYESQQSVTVESLKKLQTSLERCPDETMTTDDPEGLRVKLLPHQNQALTWLLWRECQTPSGGILADDMGLGKTLTMLALILKSKQLKKGDYQGDNTDSESDEDELPSSDSEGGSLVVCPASVMSQWEAEIRTKMKPNLLTCCVHHGTKREKNSKRLKRFDVVITTYAVVQREKSCSGSLFGVKWKRIILDESHVIRNPKSLTSLAVFDLKGKTRWCLTGTPIQNKALDFYSVVKFVKVKPFNDFALWKKWVDNGQSAGLDRLAVINKTLMLRRTKEDIQKKGGLKDLKAKNVENIMFHLDKEEFDLYEKVSHFSKTVLAQFLHQRAEKAQLFAHGVPVNRAKEHFAQLSENNPFKDHPELEKLFKNLSSMRDIKTHQILVLLLRLRQICSHPHLAVNILDKVELTGEGINDEDGMDIDLLNEMQNMTLNSLNISSENGATATPSILSPNHPVFKRDRRSSKIKVVVDVITEICTNSDDKIVVVSQWTSMLQILEEVLGQMGIKSLNLNGSIPVPKRAPIIEEFNSKSLKRKVLLLSLTSGGVGLNLIGGNHLLLIDLHWNPQLEAQAFDRVYRVGQSKPVHIYKFICSDTIEERILKLQEHKLEIAKNVMTGSRNTTSNKLTIDEIKSLFSL